MDDFIVRGTTSGPIVRLLREGGATEVHVRVSSPPVRHPCFMGIDMARGEELIGHSKTVDEIRQHIGADSLAYLSHEGDACRPSPKSCRATTAIAALVSPAPTPSGSRRGGS